MKVDTSKFEGTLLFFTAVYFLFTSVNINSSLGLTYVCFTFLSAIFILYDTDRTIKFRKENDTLFGALLVGASAYAVLIILSSYIIVPGVNKILELLGSTTPVLASNPFFNKITFGIGVPISETVAFFAIALDFLATSFKVPIKKDSLFNTKTWLLIIGISLAFLFFHLTSKGISAIPTLVVVFFMAILSITIVIWRQSYEAAIYMHIIANLSALMFAAKLI